MTIQELGSIGEFVAAIATIATLAYLAIQIRAGARASVVEAKLQQSERVFPVRRFAHLYK